MSKKKQEDLMGPAPGIVQPQHLNEWGLTEMQEDFCQNYIREVNATLAAKQAGYSQHTAGEQGYRLLREAHILKRVQMLRLNVDKGNDGLREKIIRKLMIMADLDVATLYDEEGNLKPVHEWDLEARTSIQGIDTTHDLLGFNTTKKIKLSERTKALDMLIKMQGYNAAEKAPVDQDGNHVAPVFNINIVPPQKDIG